MKIHLTVILKSKTENIELFASKLKELVTQSTKEAACLQYDLHQSKEDPSIFIFHETWKDKEGLDNHNQQSYIQEFFATAKTLLEVEPIVYSTSRVA
ncbi:putative quinol monooxygenase [Flavobacterium degerlachei]|jgi:quinol monooxygenase YgiN|uniref:Quinol monooxygenase YgiN n=1 Tax=Flavobacterium degerlachei TaxID=229203 RepID=A0A1H3EXH1_9FLAO|nr:putative quinol monooxygenase [Flavobacterium degerlachei]SDX83476.1 Quinol monooxygenase YgiN [Flavobacterium degerlachei]